MTDADDIEGRMRALASTRARDQVSEGFLCLRCDDEVRPSEPWRAPTVDELTRYRIVAMNAPAVLVANGECSGCFHPGLLYRKQSAVDLARARLEAAALAIGDCHLAGIDPGWNESNEVEQASILYAQAVRAEQEGK